MKIQKVFIVFAKKQEDYDRILMLISNNKRNIICSNAISIIELIYNYTYVKNIHPDSELLLNMIDINL